ncbi:hypothetical protein ILT42_01010 [Microvirga sp. BT291]|nr:hypothetical protein [Microvirga pudoricolor]
MHAFETSKNDSVTIAADGLLRTNNPVGNAINLRPPINSNWTYVVSIAGAAVSLSAEAITAHGNIDLTVLPGGVVSGGKASYFAVGTHTIMNGGSIVSTSSAAALSFGGTSKVHLTNTGIIKNVDNTLALDMAGDGNRIVENRLLIQGDILVSGLLASADIRNSGIIEGNVTGNVKGDVYSGTGTVTGLIDLRSGDNHATGGGGDERFKYDNEPVATYTPETLTNFFDGGGGVDTLTIRSRGILTVDLQKETQQATGLGHKLTVKNIEHLILETIDGTSEANFTGNASGNKLVGGKGNDTLNGGGGADTLIGGGGNDRYYVDHEDDEIRETPNGGYDIVYTTLKSTKGFYEVEEVVYIGAADPGNPTPGTPTPPATSPTTPTPIPVPVGKSYQIVAVQSAKGGTVYAGSSDSLLLGKAGRDKLHGGAGDDRLYGKGGLDWLKGGAGKDAFVFDTRPSAKNVDTISGFSSADDTIELAKSAFGKIGPKGALKKAAFYVSEAAHVGNDRIVYDKGKGILWYDRDGDGAAAAVQIARFDKKPTLTHADFLIV